MKAELKISSRSHIDYREVAVLMAGLGVSSTVYETMSSVSGENNEPYTVESGVCIQLYKVTREKLKDAIWPALREAYDIECAHISDTEGSSCCVYDYVRDTACPVEVRRREGAHGV